jgi:hypothetical protein
VVVVAQMEVQELQAAQAVNLFLVGMVEMDHILREL